METLRQMRYIAKPCNHWVSFDLKFLRYGNSPQGQRGVHIELKWSIITVMRAPYGVVAKPIRFPKANRRVHQQAKGSRNYDHDGEKQVGV